MACDSCGAKRGHYPGCPHYSGKQSGRKKKGEDRKYVTPKERTCSWCGGTGKRSGGRDCTRCGGSGNVPTK